MTRIRGKAVMDQLVNWDCSSGPGWWRLRAGVRLSDIFRAFTRGLKEEMWGSKRYDGLDPCHLCSLQSSLSWTIKGGVTSGVGRFLLVVTAPFMNTPFLTLQAASATSITSGFLHPWCCQTCDWVSRRHSASTFFRNSLFCIHAVAVVTRLHAGYRLLNAKSSTVCHWAAPPQQLWDIQCVQGLLSSRPGCGECFSFTFDSNVFQIQCRNVSDSLWHFPILFIKAPLWSLCGVH